MLSTKTRLTVALFAVLGLAAAAGPAAARDWVASGGWARVPIRAYAAAAAPLAGTVRGGDYLDLTGRCTRDLDLKAIAYMSGFRQRLIVSTRWCEVAGPVHGWVFGGFMKPW